jgi:hypothetical protein
MNIESLEINLLKVSEIKDGDIVIVKVNDNQKLNLDKEAIKNLYEKITKMFKKEIPIYFFPSNVNFEIIKRGIDTVEDSVNKIENENE